MSETLKPKFDNSYAEKKAEEQKYVRTAILMLVKAVNDVTGKNQHTCVQFKYGSSYYVVVKGVTQDREFTEAVKKKMLSYVEADLPVEPVMYRTIDAIRKARKEGDVKQEQLLNYSGTLLLVSHDREFLDNVVTSTFVLEGDGEVRQYPGGYADYERQRTVPAASRREALAGGPPVTAPRREDASGTVKKLSYNEQRELAALPAKIDALEREITAIEAFLSDGSNYARDPAKCKSDAERLTLAKSKLDAAESRWLELEERNGKAN